MKAWSEPAALINSDTTANQLKEEANGDKEKDKRQTLAEGTER